MPPPEDHGEERPDLVSVWMRERLTRVQSAAIAVLIEFLMFIVVVAMAYASLTVARHLWSGITGGPSVETFRAIILEVLTVLIFVEIFSLLYEYLRSHRIRITYLVDTSLAVIFREVWVFLFTGEAGWQEIMALAFLLLAVGGLRVLAVKYSPG
ncbi:MAG: hypothetical protein Kow00129_05360 [Thermoleophilia bacterium]